MLKMIEIELEFISNINMYLYVAKGTREGISYIAERFSRANNKYLKLFDDKKPRKYIMYLGGWAMRQYLPYSGFK